MNFSRELFTTPIPNSYSNATSYYNNITYLFLALHSISTIVGLQVHFYVLWLICKGKGSGISAEFFYLNLAVCEILSCLGSLAYVLTLWIPRIYEVTCFIMALPLFGRPLIQCLICMERYLAVLHPVSFLKYKPLRYRLSCSAVVWVTVLGFCVFCRLTVGRGNMYMFFCVFLPVSLVLFIINLSCSVAILKALKHPKAGQKVKDRREANKIKRKASHLILIITVSMFIQSVPVHFVGIVVESLKIADFQMSWRISTCVSMIMAYVAPILYICRVKKG